MHHEISIENWYRWIKIQNAWEDMLEILSMAFRNELGRCLFRRWNEQTPEARRERDIFFVTANREAGKHYQYLAASALFCREKKVYSYLYVLSISKSSVESVLADVFFIWR